MDKEAVPANRSPNLFPPTRWSAILPAGTAGGANMGAVYEAYREPLILYLICLRHQPADALDLVHGFFADLIRRDSLSGVSSKKGRFRTFLITSLKNHVNDQRDRASTFKRGGGQALLSVDELLARQGVDRALVERRGPDWAYDRAWANAVLKVALNQLEWEMAQGGKSALFAALSPVMHQDAEAGSYREIATKLNMTEGAVKVAAKRLRDRLGEQVRQQIRATVPDDQEYEAELRYLIELLGQA
ncbi:MAG: RNA polymerase sigma factor [Verrucomicrobiia bacterium]